METRVDRFGRIVIPKQMRDELGLTPGTVVEVRRGDRGCVVEPVSVEPDLVERDGVLVFTGQASGDVAGALDAGRKARLKHLGAGP